MFLMYKHIVLNGEPLHGGPDYAPFAVQRLAGSAVRHTGCREGCCFTHGVPCAVRFHSVIFPRFSVPNAASTVLRYACTHTFCFSASPPDTLSEKQMVRSGKYAPEVLACGQGTHNAGKTGQMKAPLTVPPGEVRTCATRLSATRTAKSWVQCETTPERFWSSEPSSKQRQQRTSKVCKSKISASRRRLSGLSQRQVSNEPPPFLFFLTRQ